MARRWRTVLGLLVLAVLTTGVAAAEASGTIVVRVYADLAGRGGCDAFYSAGSDWPLKGATVTLTLPSGERREATTNAAGYAYFFGVSIPERRTGAVTVSFPGLYQFHSLEACPNSPLTQRVTAESFTLNVVQLTFRARLSTQAPGECYDTILNGGFENQLLGWRVDAVGTPAQFAIVSVARTGARAARLGSVDNAAVALSQILHVPSTTLSARLSFSFWLQDGNVGDEFTVQISTTGLSPQVVRVLTQRGGEPTYGWRTVTFDIPADVLQTIRTQEAAVVFSLATDDARPTTVLIDDVMLTLCR
jgi:hypothetical protein